MLDIPCFDEATFRYSRYDTHVHTGGWSLHPHSGSRTGTLHRNLVRRRLLYPTSMPQEFAAGSCELGGWRGSRPAHPAALQRAKNGKSAHARCKGKASLQSIKGKTDNMLQWGTAQLDEWLNATAMPQERSAPVLCVGILPWPIRSCSRSICSYVRLSPSPKPARPGASPRPSSSSSSPPSSPSSGSPSSGQMRNRLSPQNRGSLHKAASHLVLTNGYLFVQ
jgi:hypothetical protein